MPEIGIIYMLYKHIGSALSRFFFNKKNKNSIRNAFLLKDNMHLVSDVNKRYERIIKKIRNYHHSKKIKIAFIVGEKEKWTLNMLYAELYKSEKFKPIILVVPSEVGDPKESTIDNYNFFKNMGFEVEKGYDVNKRKYLDIRLFSPDIVFYQQPWSISKSHSIKKLSKYFLTCYVPYCFYMLSSDRNYKMNFHALLWKYFVEFDEYKSEYFRNYNIDNCEVSGSVKLDGYLEKKNGNKYNGAIIYAPHHSFNDGHKFSAFLWSGKHILDLAKKHRNFKWIFKPHPFFREKLVKNGIMTPEEAENYFYEWRDVGEIHIGSGYHDIFSSSRLLITDSISFLAEYFPTKNPVFFLRSHDQVDDFTDVGSKIVKNYYHLRKSDDIYYLFNRVIIDGDDYMMKSREDSVRSIGLDLKKSSSERIVNYLLKEVFSS